MDNLSVRGYVGSLDNFKSGLIDWVIRIFDIRQRCGKSLRSFGRRAFRLGRLGGGLEALAMMPLQVWPEG